MRGFERIRLARAGREQRGINLVELLVVIGIIVALAAVTVPLVIHFSGAVHSRRNPLGGALYVLPSIPCWPTRN